MSHCVATFLDEEERVVYVGVFQIDDETDEVIEQISEDAYTKEHWADMNDDTWLREIPVIRAEMEANSAIVKAQFFSKK
jgi:hypothetical protein